MNAFDLYVVLGSIAFCVIVGIGHLVFISMKLYPFTFATDRHHTQSKRIPSLIQFRTRHLKKCECGNLELSSMVVVYAKSEMEKPPQERQPQYAGKIVKCSCGEHYTTIRAFGSDYERPKPKARKNKH